MAIVPVDCTGWTEAVPLSDSTGGFNTVAPVDGRGRCKAVLPVDGKSWLNQPTVGEKLRQLTVQERPTQPLEKTASRGNYKFVGSACRQSIKPPIPMPHLGI